jgi:hypothetical protein
MKPFTTVAALLLGFIALMQGLRFALAWPITVNGYSVPVWASAIAFVVLGVIAIMVWRERRVR